ncbi:MAG TPA: PQQ-dependent sugar dehydrogenase [Rhodospirillales bacterium]|nr:PQQ-dependent sugar dehydrogenase [Rhodospirillales bacterium]
MLPVGAVLALATGCASFDLGTPARAVEPGEVFESSAQRFRLHLVTDGLERPWGLAFLPDGSMLVTERVGRLRRVAADGTLDPRPVGGLPEIWAEGQGGLLDVALDPDFATNRLVYFSYSALGEDGLPGTRVARGRLAGDRLEEVEVIFVSNGRTSTGRHFGSRLLFDREGYLYITSGDRGRRELAQDLRSHAGKVLRILPDGSVPPDNPFVGREDALPEIYTWGNRNPQGMALHPVTGEVWIHEHGPQGGDEINLLEPGANYGWPVITYGREYGTGLPIGEGTAKEGMEQPLWYWVPSIAPSGMAFYTGDRLPGWTGDLFVGALRAQTLVRLEVTEDAVISEERLLEGRIGRIRDVREGPDGYLYLLNDATDGGIWRIEPAS